MEKDKPAAMVNFSVNLNPELIQQIEQLAEKENRSRNNMIQCLLDRGLQQTENKKQGFITS